MRYTEARQILEAALDEVRKDPYDDPSRGSKVIFDRLNPIGRFYLWQNIRKPRRPGDVANDPLRIPLDNPLYWERYKYIPPTSSSPISQTVSEGADLERQGFASKKGMPRRAARKLAYALKSGEWSKAHERYARRSGSTLKRYGKKLDAALGDFSKRTGIPLKEAVSTNDPNRGRPGRAKTKLPPGQDPYDMYARGEIRPYDGKLQKRLRSLSREDRARYYREVGMRSRAASRAGKTGRLFPQG